MSACNCFFKSCFQQLNYKACQDIYESFKDESSSPSKSSISSAKKTSNTNSKYTKELSFVSLINAIKDDDSELVDSILKANKNAPEFDEYYPDELERLAE